MTQAQKHKNKAVQAGFRETEMGEMLCFLCGNVIKNKSFKTYIEALFIEAIDDGYALPPSYFFCKECKQEIMR